MGNGTAYTRALLRALVHFGQDELAEAVQRAFQQLLDRLEADYAPIVATPAAVATAGEGGVPRMYRCASDSATGCGRPLTIL